MRSCALAGCWLAAGLLILALGGCGTHSQAAPSFHATDITGVPWGQDFHLTDTAGKMRSMADFRGKAVALYFGYTHCPDACPTTLAKLNAAVQVLGPQGRAVQVIFVTVDPARDTPATLARYVRAFNPAFLGLSGTPAQIHKTAADFKIYYAKQASRQGQDYTVDHSSNVYVFDPQGRLRLTVGPQESVADIASDLRQLLPPA